METLRRVTFCKSGIRRTTLWQFVVGDRRSESIECLKGVRYFAKKRKSKTTSAPATKESASPEFVLSLQNVSKLHPTGRPIIQNVNLQFIRGAKIGVLGLNGSGKSTLLKILAGTDKEFDGAVWRKEGLRVSYLPQEPILDPNRTVIENIMDGQQRRRGLLARFNEISLEMGKPDADFDVLLEEQASVQQQIEEEDCWDLDRKLEIAMDALRVPSGDSAIESLSGGQKRRVALCRTLLEAPDLLLLDEPTNHLDAESVSWLETFLKKFSGGVIAITHDRYFLDNVAEWILEIDRGVALPFKGNYTSWLEQKRHRLSDEQKKEAALKKILDRELKWIRSASPTAKSKARQKAVEELQDEATKFEKISSGTISIPPGPRLGNKVITVDNVSKKFEDKVLFSNLSFTLEKGSIVGIIGANGTGKSTLFNILDGLLVPDAGSISYGESVRIGHVSQSREDLDPNKSVYEEVADGDEMVIVGDRTFSVRSYVAAFNLKGPMQEKPVGSLSGGERNRVHLAKFLKKGFNVLLLDEPTNDLDVETLRALEDALVEFAGCAVIISHDRWFLDRICTHTIAFRGEGQVAVYPGNYSAYEAHLRERYGESVVKESRFKDVAM